jgi:hypothetical protein
MMEVKDKMDNKEIETKINESVEELVKLVTDEFSHQLELKRKARNKMKAAKRKGKIGNGKIRK